MEVFIMISKTYNPLELSLDFQNPRFSLFSFSSEEEIISHLLIYENLYELIDSYLGEGYNTLGERIIVLDDNESIIVLEGNRRIAAIKCIFKYDNLLKSSYVYSHRIIPSLPYSSTTSDINKYHLCHINTTPV